MERPGPGSHFKHSHVRVQYGVVCSFIGLHASRHHNNDNNNLKKSLMHDHMSKRTCVQACKKKQKTKTIHQLSTYCTRALSLLGKRDPSRVCLSSLGVECTPIQYTHTHSRTVTEGHDANATVGYTDYSADCAHWEAAAGKVASSFWS